jgi:xylose isomerase
MQDFFHAHIGGMDIFARALITADKLRSDSPLEGMRTDRYASFDAGEGQAFESGALSLLDLHKLASKNGEPVQISGQQELYENILNRFI